MQLLFASYIIELLAINLRQLQRNNTFKKYIFRIPAKNKSMQSGNISCLYLLVTIQEINVVVLLCIYNTFDNIKS